MSYTIACDLTAEYIADGRLFCNPNRPAEVILQGKIVSITEKNSTNLLMMQEWVRDKPTIVIQGAQLKVDPECSVELENLGDTEYGAYSAVNGVGLSLYTISCFWNWGWRCSRYRGACCHCCGGPHPCEEEENQLQT